MTGEHGPGRPEKPLRELRDFRANLMLDDRRERVWSAILDDLSRRLGRKVVGTHLLDMLTRQLFERIAGAKGMTLLELSMRDRERELELKRAFRDMLRHSPRKKTGA